MITKEVKPTKRKDYNKDARAEWTIRSGAVTVIHPDRQRKFHDSWLLALFDSIIIIIITEGWSFLIFLHP